MLKRFLKRFQKAEPVQDPPSRPQKTAELNAKRPEPADAAPRRRRRRRPRKKTPAPTTAPSPSPPWDPSLFQVPEQEGATRFHDLQLRDEIMHAVYDLGFQYCTPVQTATLPAALKGEDIAARAQTGTGKTAAFLISMIQRFLQSPLEQRSKASPRALILAPTRELVMQIEKDAHALGKHTPIRVLSIVGGVHYDKQKRPLEQQNPEIVVATPGRLLDLKSNRSIDLQHVEVLVIDEADRMLDMGFIPDVRRIVRSTPFKDQRQTMLFSATLTEEVTRLAGNWTRRPVEIDIDPEQVTVDTVNQVVYIVTARDKFALLYNILHHEALQRVLMFANRRDTTARLEERLKAYGINCSLISGALPQSRRTRTLEAFRAGTIRVLVATDVASRGLHIDNVEHVINYNIPEDPEDYVHRIGRTGRAGATGTSITFACEDEAMMLPAVEEFIGKPLPCTRPPEAWLHIPPDVKPKRVPAKRPARGSGRTTGRRPPPRGRRPRTRR